MHIAYGSLCTTCLVAVLGGSLMIGGCGHLGNTLCILSHARLQMHYKVHAKRCFTVKPTGHRGNYGWRVVVLIMIYTCYDFAAI